MFEIATQFNAIFRAQTNAKKISVILLSMWVSRRVQSFLDMLATQLNRVESSAALRDAFDSCVFFAVSMGRLGADFSGQLPSLFEEKMQEIVVQFWKEGVNQLSETLKICREAGVASPLHSSILTGSGPSENSNEGDDGPLPPPRQLMALPPLGRLVNAYLKGLNEIRRCLLPGVFLTLRQSLKESLSEVSAILQANERAVMTPGLRGHAVRLRGVAKEMSQVMKDVVQPYVLGALELSLGSVEAAREFHDTLILSAEEDTEDLDDGKEYKNDSADDEMKAGDAINADEEGAVLPEENYDSINDSTTE